jgi:hypothetical protein
MIKADLFARVAVTQASFLQLIQMDPLNARLAKEIAKNAFKLQQPVSHARRRHFSMLLASTTALPASTLNHLNVLDAHNVMEFQLKSRLHEM